MISHAIMAVPVAVLVVRKAWPARALAAPALPALNCTAMSTIQAVILSAVNSKVLLDTTESWLQCGVWWARLLKLH